MTLNEARRLSKEIGDAAAALNQKIAAAAGAGMMVKVEQMDVQVISSEFPIPFISAVAKVSPELIEEGEAHGDRKA